MNLEEIRTEIDALDKELLALFERRMDLCRDVALYKKEHNLPVFQPEREEKLLDKIEHETQGYVHQILMPSLVERSTCRSIQEDG